MKTAEQIERLIDKNKIEVLKLKPSQKKEKAKFVSEIAFYNEMLIYIRTNPRPEFIEEEIKRLQSKKDLILNECDKLKNKRGEPDKIRIASFKAVQGYSQINKQLKTLNFLSC